MGSVLPEPPQPWTETPLVFSSPLTRAAGCNIFLKLENVQPSGSFKSRGIGNMMLRAVADSPSAGVHFYCSSGGNAGLACATSAISLGRKATIVVPNSTSAFMIEKLRALDADVVQIGANWAEADRYLREELLEKHDPNRKSVYVPPFDHPDVWTGASFMVDELVQQMDQQHGGKSIDAVVCNVGGGGLLNGIMEGRQRHQKRLSATKVLAVETIGAESLHASVKAGEHVALPGITSIATSLGAVKVSDRTWQWAQEAGPDLVSAVVSDAEAVRGCVRFLDDARILVEAACGASIAQVYNGDMRRHLGAGMTDEQWAKLNIVVIICGGSNISLDILTKYRQTYGV